MNRRERRARERKGEIPKPEPTYTLKHSDIKSLNEVGKKAMLHEIHQQCLIADKAFTLDLDTLYIWTLYNKYGWSKKKLKKFYLDVFSEHLRMREFYEMDEMYPERHILKDKGVDIEAWYNELFDEKGNFKNPEEVNWDDLC